MKTNLSVGLMLAALSAAVPNAGAADAAQAEALAKKYNCMQCHSADKKVLGPSYKDVAKKYKGNKDARAMLAKNVKAGSKGVWGPIPMPANDKASDAEIATLVEWILSM